MQDPQFTFGPRHRLVTSTRGFSWVRAGLTVAVGVALGVMLLFACGLAHADTRSDSLQLCQRSGEVTYVIAMMRDAGQDPRNTYATAENMAKKYGFDTAPLEALVWSVYIHDGRMSPAALRAESFYECRKARGLL